MRNHLTGLHHLFKSDRKKKFVVVKSERKGSPDNERDCVTRKMLKWRVNVWNDKDIVDPEYILSGKNFPFTDIPYSDGPWKPTPSPSSSTMDFTS